MRQMPTEELPHAGELSVALSVGFGADPALWGYLPAGTDPQPFAERLAAALNLAVREAVPEFSLRLWPEVRVTVAHAKLIPTLAERRAEEEARIAAGPPVVDEPCGRDGRFTRTGSYLTGYAYKLDGRPYVHSSRCELCHEFGTFADTGRCEDCEERLAPLRETGEEHPK